MYQFWPDLQLPKAKIKMPWATAECDKIPKMGKIICFYVNTHVLKSEPGYFVTFSHRYCIYLNVSERVWFKKAWALLLNIRAEAEVYGRRRPPICNLEYR